MKTSVVMPIYNERGTLREVVRRVLAVPLDLELICVDDCSTDGSREVLSQLQLEHPQIRAYLQPRNKGKGAALRRGIEEATGDFVVIQDADLEYPVSHIPRLVEPICSGVTDVVFGSRFMGNCNGMGTLHRLGNFMLSIAASILYGVKLTDVMTGHKAISMKAFSSLNLTEKDFAVEVEITSKILNSGWRILEIPIVYSYRKHGRAKIRFSDGLKCLLRLLHYRISGKNETSQA